MSEPAAAIDSEASAPHGCGIDAALIQKYNVAGPRYTSYPTANHFSEQFGLDDYRAALDRRALRDARAPLSLYFHIPFCDVVCYYCACNKIVTANHARAVPYVDHLVQEVRLQAVLLGTGRRVEQLHWGGGTPTFLNHAQMRQLMSAVRAEFELVDDAHADYSVEVDPRRADRDTVALLRELGFNRMSIGVQDFDPAVQRAVNRIQSAEETAAVLEAARREGFGSINVDLIYGLPLQSVASFARTLDEVLQLAPDRLSIFNYAHLPELFKTQRQIDASELPAPETKLEILGATIDRLSSAGYVHIGMDHFAKHTDPLAQARQSGTLCRNFQGYSTHGNCDMIAMGVTGIGVVGDCYAQNTRQIDDYYDEVSAGRVPIVRGVLLSDEDRARRHIIMRLICDGRLDLHEAADVLPAGSGTGFESELRALQNMAEDGLVTIDESVVRVTALGQFFVRNICMVFDPYHQANRARAHSRTI